MRCAPIQLREVRRAHLGHEQTVRSIAAFYWFVAFVSGTTAYVMASRSADTKWIPLGIALGVCATAHHAGMKLWNLEAAGAVTGSLLCLLFAVGTLDTVIFVVGERSPSRILAVTAICWLMPAHILAALRRKKGLMVLAPEYQHAIRVTPEMRYPYALPSIVAFVLCVLFWLGTCVTLLVPWTD